jgi:o-succinylbenzoate---CoA ligase
MPKIPCPLDVAAREHGSKAAVMWGARRISFLQLNQFVNTTVKAFKERNLKAGSRVALVAGNTVEAVIILLSLWRLGAVACAINPRFPNSKIATLLKKVKASAVVIDQPGALQGIQLGISKIMINDLIVFDVKDSFYKNDTTAFLTMDTEQEAAVIFTSGTAGEAKAALLTYGNLYYNALGSNEVIKLSPGDRWILSLPLYHVAGLGVLMRSLIAGATVAITRQEDLLKRLTDGKTTHVSLVPTQLFRLFNDQNFVGAQRAVPLRAILLGGSAIPQSLVEESLKRKLPLYVSYGLTEMASQVATGSIKKAGEPCARVLAHRQLTVKNGEICVRGAALFKGYLEGEKITRPLDAEGWFHTGDLGVLDQNGFLQVFGRRDNMFISGGENIHPEEIEGVLMKIDGINQAVVVPKEDKEFGHRPVAFIQWNTEAHLHSGDALTKYLAGELPKFKIPAAFYPWPDTVKEGIKPDRKTLIELAKKNK